MAKTKKKRLSKKAKAALKVLEESKLLDNSATNAGKTDPTFTPNTPSFTNKKAHKARPNKKRG